MKNVQFRRVAGWQFHADAAEEGHLFRRVRLHQPMVIRAADVAEAAALDAETLGHAVVVGIMVARTVIDDEGDGDD